MVPSLSKKGIKMLAQKQVDMQCETVTGVVSLSENERMHTIYMYKSLSVRNTVNQNIFSMNAAYCKCMSLLLECEPIKRLV